MSATISTNSTDLLRTSVFPDLTTVGIVYDAPTFPRSNVECEIETIGILLPENVSRWLPAMLKTLSRMQSLSKYWESSGAEAPNKTALKNAQSVLEYLSSEDFQPSSIEPSTGEGVCISFRKGDRYADIECFNTGEILGMTKVDFEEPSIWETDLSQLEDDVFTIRQFVE